MIRKHNKYFFLLTIMLSFNTILGLWLGYSIAKVLAVSQIEWGGGNWAILGSH